MFRANRSAKETTPYAVPADFCQLFDREVNGLYLLAVLLTANRALAETCIIGGLEDSLNSNRVFMEWANIWARRMSGLLPAADNAPTLPQNGSDVASHPGHLIAKAHARLRYHLIRNPRSAV